MGSMLVNIGGHTGSSHEPIRDSKAISRVSPFLLLHPRPCETPDKVFTPWHVIELL